MRTLTKLAFIAAAGAAAVTAVRRYDLINRGAVLAEQSIGKVTEFANDLLAKYDEYTSDQTEEEPAEESTAHTRGPVDGPGGASVGYGEVR